MRWFFAENTGANWAGFSSSGSISPSVYTFGSSTANSSSELGQLFQIGSHEALAIYSDGSNINWQRIAVNANTLAVSGTGGTLLTSASLDGFAGFDDPVSSDRRGMIWYTDSGGVRLGTLTNLNGTPSISNSTVLTDDPTGISSTSYGGDVYKTPQGASSEIRGIIRGHNFSTSQLYGWPWFYNRNTGQVETASGVQIFNFQRRWQAIATGTAHAGLLEVDTSFNVQMRRSVASNWPNVLLSGSIGANILANVSATSAGIDFIYNNGVEDYFQYYGYNSNGTVYTGILRGNGGNAISTIIPSGNIIFASVGTTNFESLLFAADAISGDVRLFSTVIGGINPTGSQLSNLTVTDSATLDSSNIASINASNGRAIALQDDLVLLVYQAAGGSIGYRSVAIQAAS